MVGVTPRNRWYLSDPYETYVFENNPNDMTSPLKPQNTESRPPSPVDTRVRPNRKVQAPWNWEFSGNIRTEEHYRALEHWARKRHRVTLVDHYGRVWDLHLVHFDVRSKPTTFQSQWRFQYTMQCMVYGGPDPKGVPAETGQFVALTGFPMQNGAPATATASAVATPMVFHNAIAAAGATAQPGDDPFIGYGKALRPGTVRARALIPPDDFVDDFNRLDGSLGDDWNIHRGNWAIKNGRVVLLAGATTGTGLISTSPGFSRNLGSDPIIDVAVTAATGTLEFYYLLVAVDPVTRKGIGIRRRRDGYIYVGHFTGGAWTNLSTTFAFQAAPKEADDLYWPTSNERVRVTYNKTTKVLNVYLDGVQVGGDYTYAGANDTGSYVALVSPGQYYSTAWWDDFAATGSA